MEVRESKWVSKAIDNVDRYLHRGGHLKGDKPQVLGGPDLLNTIGIAMGLPVEDPIYWTSSEKRKAMRGELVYFVGNARKTINVIAEQIRSCCDGDDENYVTVLPIELYSEGKLFEVPLFRVHRYKDSKKYYIDNIGRYYDSVSDWYSNNKLPPCKMAYPFNLRLTLKPGYDYSRVKVADTPSARDDAEICRGVDTVFKIAGTASSLGLCVATGGIATPFAIAGTASTLWGTGRTVYQMVDRATHGQTLNPFTNTESRLLWLGITEKVFSLSAKGATKQLMRRGPGASTAAREYVDFLNKSKLVVGGINRIENTIYMIENYHKFSKLDVVMHLLSIAFWAKDVYKFKTADTLIAERYSES